MRRAGEIDVPLCPDLIPVAHTPGALPDHCPTCAPFRCEAAGYEGGLPCSLCEGCCQARVTPPAPTHPEEADR